jgi:hypothetical protein
MGKSARGTPRFVGLHWKGFLWMSSLLLALSAAFYGLSYHELMRQFHRAYLRVGGGGSGA